MNYLEFHCICLNLPILLRRIITKGGIILIRKISLVGVLLFSSLASFSTVSASESPTNELPEKIVENGFEIEYLEYSDTFQKLQYTNLLTGEVEFLEIEYDGDDVTTTSITDDNVVEMKRDGDIFTEHNLTTNEISVTDLANETDEKVINRSKKVSSSKLQPTNSGDVSPMVVPGGQGGEYYLQHTWYRSKSIDRNDLSYIVGLIVTISTKSVNAGIASGTALWYFNSKAPNIWYKEQIYYWKDMPHYLGISIMYYKYPDYTNYINSTWRTVNH